MILISLLAQFRNETVVVDDTNEEIVAKWIYKQR